MKQITASVFFNIKPPKLGNNIFLISFDFRIKFYQNLTTTSYRCHRNDRKIGGKIIWNI